MRSAINKACTLLGVQAFGVDVDGDSCVDSGEAVGSDTRAAPRVWVHRFCALRWYMSPAIVLPIRDNFLCFRGRRVRRLGLPDDRKRVLLLRGADLRAALKVYKNADQEVFAQARDRGEAIDHHENKNHRVQCRAFPSVG